MKPYYRYNYYNYGGPSFKMSLEDGVISATLSLPGIKKKEIDLSYSHEDEGIYLTIQEQQKYFIPIQHAIDETNIIADLDLGILTIKIPTKDTRTAIQIK